LVPQDIFYDPSEEEYDYDNSLHTTSSNLRAQRSYFRKHNPLEYQQSVFDDNPLLAKNFKYNFPDFLIFTPEVILKLIWMKLRMITKNM